MGRRRTTGKKFARTCLKSNGDSQLAAGLGLYERERERIPVPLPPPCPPTSFVPPVIICRALQKQYPCRARKIQVCRYVLSELFFFFVFSVYKEMIYKRHARSHRRSTLLQDYSHNVHFFSVASEIKNFSTVSKKNILLKRRNFDQNIFKKKNIERPNLRDSFDDRRRLFSSDLLLLLRQRSREFLVFSRLAQQRDRRHPIVRIMGVSLRLGNSSAV